MSGYRLVAAIRLTALAVVVAVLTGGRLGAGREDTTRGFLITR